MTRNRARLVLLPGMGADHRLFAPQRGTFANLEVPPWLEPCRGETLEAYGRRIAATIDVREPFYLGGASFGGMVALETARHLAPEAVFLIGGCRSGRSVAAYLRFLERLSRLLPASALELSRGLSPLVVAKLGELEPRQKALVLEMLLATPLDFIRWASSAVLNWTFDAELACPIRHIHGDRDRLVPCRSVQPDRVVVGGGHLVNLTHPDEVNACLLEWMSPH